MADKDSPKRFSSFDSYTEHGAVIILTKEYNDLHGDIVPIENHISIDRAKEIVKQLQEAIKYAEKHKEANP